MLAFFWLFSTCKNLLQEYFVKHLPEGDVVTRVFYVRGVFAPPCKNL